MNEIDLSLKSAAGLASLGAAGARHIMAVQWGNEINSIVCVKGIPCESGLFRRPSHWFAPLGTVDCLKRTISTLPRAETPLIREAESPSLLLSGVDKGALGLAAPMAVLLCPFKPGHKNPPFRITSMLFAHFEHTVRTPT